MNDNRLYIMKDFTYALVHRSLNLKSPIRIFIFYNRGNAYTQTLNISQKVTKSERKVIKSMRKVTKSKGKVTKSKPT